MIKIIPISTVRARSASSSSGSVFWSGSSFFRLPPFVWACGSRDRKILKKNKALFRRGVVSCANHVHLWDYIAVMKAIRPFRSNLLAWAKNVRGENAGLIRMVGGIPIPEGDPHAAAFNKTIKELLAGGGWLHIYAEGSMWEYYAPIRPFKSGVGYFAVQCEKPVLPMAFSYRKPGWIRRVIFRQTACFTLSIGEPIFADPALPRRRASRTLSAAVTRRSAALRGSIPPATPIRRSLPKANGWTIIPCKKSTDRIKNPASRTVGGIFMCERNKRGDQWAFSCFSGGVRNTAAE